MPELPEVETVRRQLASKLVGRTITHVDVGRERSVRRTSARAVIDGLTGRTVTEARRRGKYLLVDLDTEASVMVHLRMTGQLLLADPNSPRPPHTHLAARLSGTPASPEAELRFVDPRTFGEVVVFDRTRPDDLVPELGRLGIDPVADAFTVDDLAAVVARASRHRLGPGLKAFLVDQRHVAGIGNIYADEVAHRTRLHPLRPVGTLTRPIVRRLHEAIVDILDDAIDARGSTLVDFQYVDLMGDTGSYQQHHLVYGRAGARCPTCGRGLIRTIRAGGRTTHYCPWCQRLPRRAR